MTFLVLVFMYKFCRWVSLLVVAKRKRNLFLFLIREKGSGFSSALCNTGCRTYFTAALTRWYHIYATVNKGEGLNHFVGLLCLWEIKYLKSKGWVYANSFNYSWTFEMKWLKCSVSMHSTSSRWFILFTFGKVVSLSEKLVVNFANKIPLRVHQLCCVIIISVGCWNDIYLNLSHH